MECKLIAGHRVTVIDDGTAWHYHGPSDRPPPGTIPKLGEVYTVSLVFPWDGHVWIKLKEMGEMQAYHHSRFRRVFDNDIGWALEIAKNAPKPERFVDGAPSRFKEPVKAIDWPRQ